MKIIEDGLVKSYESHEERENRKKLLKLIENVSQEFASKYNRKLIVREHNWNRPDSFGTFRFLNTSARDYFSLSEKVPRKKLLGILPRTKEEPIFAVFKNPVYIDNEKKIGLCIPNKDKDEIIKKYFKQYIQENNAKGFHIKREFSKE